ncbi:hypothetical protein [Clostridium paraputrificum]|uniref:Uncharacterized protein n=1 Tax=Clostridium paraputrificum TaxID=29363 RepID=A0A6N3FBA5_9CLOT
MFVYVNTLFKEKDEVVAAELALLKENHDISFEVVYKNNFYQLATKYANDEKDFTINDLAQIEVQHVVKSIIVPNKSFLPKEGIKDNSTVISLYDLLEDLAEEFCLYSKTIDELENNYVGYLPSFRKIRVSNSTMSVGISIHDDDKNTWRTERIISVSENRILEQHEFYCMIPRGKTNIFAKYNLEHVKSIVLNNTDYEVYKYDCSLPICNSTESFTFSDPIVVHYCTLGLRYRNLIFVLQKYVNRLTVSLKDDKAVPKKSSSFSERSGVFFTSTDTQLTGVEADDIINFALQIVKQTKEHNIELTMDIMKQLFLKSGLRVDGYSAFVCLCEIIKAGDKVPLDSLDCANRELAEHSFEYLKIQLFLYNVRVSCIYNLRVLGGRERYPRFLLYGSRFNKIVQVSIR